MSTFGHAELVELLLENGAHVYPGILRQLFKILSQSDESRRRDYGGLVVCPLRGKHEHNIHHTLKSKPKEHVVRSQRLLLENRVDVNAFKHETTNLMRAGVQGNPKMV